MSKGMKAGSFFLMIILLLGCSFFLIYTTLGKVDKGEKGSNDKVIQTEAVTLSGDISDKFVFDELELVVTDCKFSKYCGNLEGLAKAESGNVWCVVYLNAKNVSTTTKELRGAFNASSTYSFVLKYKGEYEYRETFSKYSDFFTAHDSIAPLETLENVCVSFEVPLEVKNNTDNSLCIQLSKNSREENDYVEWNLR